MNNDTNIDFGKIGEDIATKYLQEKGYVIVDRNWRCGHKEIDIIARDDDSLVIVEVKTRKSNEYGDPDLAVGSDKQKMLIWAADAYVRYHNIDLDTRFDVISIVITNDNQYIEHLEDAFYPSFISRR